MKWKRRADWLGVERITVVVDEVNERLRAMGYPKLIKIEDIEKNWGHKSYFREEDIEEIVRSVTTGIKQYWKIYAETDKGRDDLTMNQRKYRNTKLLRQGKITQVQYEERMAKPIKRRYR